MFKISKNSAFKSWKNTTYFIQYTALVEMIDENQDLPFKIEELLINSDNNNKQFMDWVKTLKIKNIKDNLQFYQK